jgi:hypothetical protein
MAGLRSFTAVWTQFEAMAPPFFFCSTGTG